MTTHNDIESTTVEILYNDLAVYGGVIAKLSTTVEILYNDLAIGISAAAKDLQQ